MGSYSPVPEFDSDRVEEIADLVHRRWSTRCERRGTPYHGVLYAGLMMTARGAQGARVQLPLRRSRDPGGAAAAALRPARALPGRREPGGLAGATAEFGDDWAVTVVLASGGYPASSSKGDVITGLDEAAALDGVEMTHAGTARRDGEIVTAGGRVLNVTGPRADPDAARRRAYDAAGAIGFDGKQMRTDIAARAVDRVAAGLAGEERDGWRFRTAGPSGERRASPRSRPPSDAEVEEAFDGIRSTRRSSA